MSNGIATETVLYTAPSQATRLVMVTRNYWTKEEDSQLRAMRGLCARRLCHEFPYRSIHSIRSRARKLGIKLPPGRVPTDVRFRGQMPATPKAHPFVRRLVDEANSQHVMLHEIADRAGVTRSAMSKWRYTCTPHLVGLIAALNVLGLDLAVVRLKETL